MSSTVHYLTLYPENVSTEDTTIPLELFSIAAGLLVVFVLLIVGIVVVASFVLKRRWTRNRSDIKVLNALLMYSEACSSLYVL